MNPKSITFFLFFFLIFFVKSYSQDKNILPKREFRAVWIATVMNIDWPKNQKDSIAKQKADYIAILDTYKKLNFNAVIVQIRSVGDAFYPTKLAPWSRFLTGKEGQEPLPYFDPLTWMIDQAHERGFEFHAWLNPYRATFDTKTENLSKEHDYFKHRDWMIKYGETGKEKFYYNPGLPEVQSHLLTIVEEVVQNYDIDAVHFDDYFYPYRVAGKVFNDAASFKKYGNALSVEDWRRKNVNDFVKNCYFSIKKIKPWVQFGISPFGVWRNKSVDPKGSDTQAGQTNYDDLYADTLAWMNEKYIDYMLPQLYWSMDHKTASYSKLIKWWSENTNNTNLYIGNSTYKINADSDKNWNNPYEIPNQIDLTRSYKNVQGNAYFSAKCFVNTNKEVADLIQKNQYKYMALTPVVPFSLKNNNDKPQFQSVIKQNDNLHFLFKKTQSKQRFLIVYNPENDKKLDVNNATQIVDKVFLDSKNETILYCLDMKKLENASEIAFSFIDFYGNESEVVIVDLDKEKNKKN